MRWDLLLVLTVVARCDAYPYYLAMLPNGANVPHPCREGQVWPGVGHFSPQGGGPRNPFGSDFMAQGEWTEELCRSDSDGDGRTNGQELGDPDCTWQPGTNATITTGLSHPGVCEPLEDERCRQRSLDHNLYRLQHEWMGEECKADQFECEGLDDPDLQNVTMRLPVTSVPAQETTYECAIFDFPDVAEAVHMVATTPVLDNTNVLHHIVLFGCTGEVNNVPTDGTGYECGMSPHRNCSSFLSIWTLGLNGECFHKAAGIKLGPTGFTRVAIQLHWNNPQEVSTYNDSSGLTLYYTPNRRPHDAGILMVGDQDFRIPPQQERFTVHSKCSSACTTSKLRQPINVTYAWNHMHYLGAAMSIEHYRNGERLRYITNDGSYSYDSPVGHVHGTPFEVRPGDELVTQCHYSSMSRNRTTVFGDSTQQEMCFGFIYYYPEQALDISERTCTTDGSLSECDPATLGGCSWDGFWSRLETIGAQVASKCTQMFGDCYAECKEAILQARRDEPCMRNEDFWRQIKRWGLATSQDGKDYLGLLASCELEIYKDEHPPTTCPAVSGPASSGHVVLASLGLVSAAVLLCLGVLAE